MLNTESPLPNLVCAPLMVARLVSPMFNTYPSLPGLGSATLVTAKFAGWLWRTVCDAHSTRLGSVGTSLVTAVFDHCTVTDANTPLMCHSSTAFVAAYFLGNLCSVSSADSSVQDIIGAPLVIASFGPRMPRSVPFAYSPLPGLVGASFSDADFASLIIRSVPNADTSLSDLVVASVNGAYFSRAVVAAPMLDAFSSFSS